MFKLDSPPRGYDELISAEGKPRFPEIMECLDGLDGEELRRRQDATERRLKDLGITFAVYGHQDGTEKRGRSIFSPG